MIAEQNVASIRVAQKIGERLERENIPGPFEEKVDLYALEASSHGRSDKPGDVRSRSSQYGSGLAAMRRCKT
jgi:hypothetical protein